MPHRYALAALGLTLAAGCTQPTSPDDTGYVLLDKEARSAAILSQDGWSGSPLFPTALDAAEPVTITTRTARTTLDLQPGRLAYLHGPTAAVEWLSLGDDLRDDRLVLHATEEAATAIAAQIGGELSTRRDGLYRLHAADIFARTTFLEPPPGLLDVLPDTALDLGLAEPAGDGYTYLLTDGRFASDEAAAEGAIARAEAGLVGIYGSALTALVLDASGGFTLHEGCNAGPVDRGRYHLAGDRVVFTPDKGAPFALARAGDTLVDPKGAVFSGFADSIRSPLDTPPEAP